jgi:aquaporin Z
MHAKPCPRARSLWHAEFAIEGALLAAFMISAIAFTVVVEHPASPVSGVIVMPVLRRLAVGLGMAATAIVLIYSPWGMRSGAHMNPAATLALARLGLVPPSSVPGYIAAHFVGGALGVWAAWQVFGSLVEHPAVRFAVTTPGRWGTGAAFAGELAMTACQMAAVLAATRIPSWRPRAGMVAALLLALYITVEAPVSGMSLNPARTLGSALWAGQFTALWVYFSAPVLGMLLAAEVFFRMRPRNKVTP